MGAMYHFCIDTCEAMLGIDTQFGKLIEFFQSSEELKNVWDNTLIIFTSDNGGSLDAGSCNYPLRGGKNTFFEGNQRVHTFGMYIKFDFDSFE